MKKKPFYSGEMLQQAWMQTMKKCFSELSGNNIERTETQVNSATV